MSELFVEVLTEELPAGAAPGALEALARGLMKALGPIPHGEVVTWGTPRRLAVAIRDVAPGRPLVRRLVTGPPAAQAWVAGAPGPAALAFARSKGVDPAELKLVDGPKGPVVAVERLEGGESTRDVVAAALHEVVAGIPFKKSMRWGTEPWRFARPVHGVVAVFDGQPIEATVLGRLTTDRSRGHWLLSPESFVVEDASAWLARLRAGWVMADPRERRRVIQHELQLAGERHGFEVRIDEGLLDEVTWLVEWPTVLVGQFDASLLDLPARLLEESMMHHQRYFPVYREGRLTNHFLVVTNNPLGDPELIAAGNARVLAARFHDAKFFYAEDRKKTLLEHGARLGGMVWIRGLGSMAERQERIRVAALRLAADVGADPEVVEAAGRRCKADLATLMVGEFPELQGHVGGLLAEAEGLGRAVGLAIEEHYYPRFAGDALPATPAGRALALAERAVLVAGCASVNLLPTASGDPQGVRRAAVGLLAILVDGELDLSLRYVLESAGFPVDEALVDFVLARQRAMLLEEAPPDLVDAVLAAGGDRPLRIHARVRACARMAATGAFGPVRATFKRVAGLVREWTRTSYALDLFQDEAEYQLHHAVQRLPGADADVDATLAALAELRPAVDRFFDRVLVMTDDAPRRENRLSLLRAIVDRFAGFADFSRLSTEQS